MNYLKENITSIFKKVLNKKNITNALFIMLGSLFCAIGINVFLSNARLISGGVTGLALIGQELFGVKAGVTILVANIPLFLISRKKIDKRFTYYSLVGILTYSISLILTQSLSSFLDVDNKLVLCIYGGIIDGIGSGLIFSHLGSVGGFGIISMLIKKKNTHIDISKISLSLDFVIVCLGTIIFGVENGLYTLIAIGISSFVMNYILKGFTSATAVFIITDHEAEVSTQLVTESDFGVTEILGKGAYSENKKQILYCVVPSNQVPYLKSIVNECDPDAFLTFFEVKEAKGKGFKKKL